MAGYTRQSSYSDGDTITAAHSNDEHNQVLAAFNNSTGHKHDGTAAEGPVIGLIGDPGVTTPLNKVVVDNTNNRVGVFVDAGGAGSTVEQLRIQDGAVVPVTNNDIDLGTSSLEFKDAFFDGTVTTDALVAGTANIDGGSVDGITLGTNSAVTQAVIDNININGATIGHTSDTDLMTLASGVVTVAGEVSMTTLDIGGTNITATAAELNLMDGNSSSSSVTIVDADQLILNDDGTMKQVTAADLKTYTGGAINSVGVVDSGSITSGFGNIDTGSSTITTTGAITGGSLTADDVGINGKVITLTGSSGDTATLTAGANGTLDIATTDTDAAAGNITITADGTAELAGTTVTLNSGGGVTLDADGGTITFADDGASLGTITSDGFTGNVVGSVTLPGSASAAGSILFKEDTDNGTNAVTLIGPASTADVTVTLPSTAGTVALTSDVPSAGISSGNVATFTSGAADNDFLRIDGTAIEGRSASEVLSDIGGQAALSFGISNTNIPIFTSGVADDDFLRIAGTSVEGRSAAEVLSDIGASAAAGSSSIVTTGALDAGSITSGFGAIDNGASAITTTGVITGGTVEATADTSAGDNAAIGYTAAEGLILTGQGSTNDVTVKNDADADVIKVPTGTTNVEIVGNLTVGGSLSGAGGKVLQVVQAIEQRNANASSAATSYTNVTGLECAITPSASSSKILVQASFYVHTQSQNYSDITLFRDSTNLATMTAARFLQQRGDSDSDNSNNGFGFHGMVTLQILDSPSSTSELDYTFQSKRADPQNNSIFFLAGGVNSIICTEIAG